MYKLMSHPRSSPSQSSRTFSPQKWNRSYSTLQTASPELFSISYSAIWLLFVARIPRGLKLDVKKAVPYFCERHRQPYSFDFETTSLILLVELRSLDPASLATLYVIGLKLASPKQ
jgi:hypothetical protein